MTDWYAQACLVLLGYGLLLWPILMFVDAPYGKRDRDGWGPGLPVRLSWLLLEVPSFIVPIVIVLSVQSLPGLAGSILLLLWLVHYFHRSFIYPLVLRPKPNARFKLIVLVLGAPVNAMIGWLIVTMVFLEPHLQSIEWVYSPQFAAGVVLFALGFSITKWSDGVLKRLRAPGDGGYYIPKGGLYRYISCPNYLGEILQWCGFALASWSLAGLAFAIYTAANLIPRALSSHAWYREQFQEYPRPRKAVVPFLL